MEYLDSPFQRRDYDPSLRHVIDIFNAIEVCIKEFGYNPNQQYIHVDGVYSKKLFHNGPMTLIDSYLHGNRTTIAIYPDWHQLFIELLSF